MDSKYTIISHQMLPSQANAAGNVHGGEIMKMMDSAAGVAAQRHAHSNAVTARVDELNFKYPVFVGDFVICKAHVIYVGSSSMEIFVTIETENLITGESRVALTAFFTMVALDKDSHPIKVEKIECPDDPYERALYYEGERRYKNSNKRKKFS
ncbi:MAG: acyl-CoA thioesterase [Firmicutes bacterium]|nr:acyl-CoA thioesterase [Bacillota bacterium]